MEIDAILTQLNLSMLLIVEISSKCCDNKTLGVTISTIVDDDCGVLFRTGSVTDEGAEVMRKTYGVPAVVSDITLGLDDLSDSPIHSEKRSDKRLQGSKPLQEQVEKRDILVRQPKAVCRACLHFKCPKK